MNNDRLHPQTIQTLRQLVKLHGAQQLIDAIREIEKILNTPPLVRKLRYDGTAEIVAQDCRST